MRAEITIICIVIGRGLNRDLPHPMLDIFEIIIIFSMDLSFQQHITCTITKVGLDVFLQRTKEPVDEKRYKLVFVNSIDPDPHNLIKIFTVDILLSQDR